MEEANPILHKTGEKLVETWQQVRRTTMQATEKVQSCFDARLAAFISGVIMSVISGLAVLAAIGGLIFVYVAANLGTDLFFSRPPDHQFRVFEVVTILTANALITVGLIFSLLELSFSVVLADGASKKKAGHLITYFVYGCVKSVLLFIASMVLYITRWDNVLGALTLLGCGVSVMFTLMAYGAYRSVQKSAKGYNKFDSEVTVQE